MIEYGIWRYVYAIYNGKALNSRGTDYNIAFPIKKDGSTDYITKIVGTYDENSCLDPTTCPESLIGPWGTTKSALKNGEAQKEDEDAEWGYTTPDNNDQWLPYGVTEFVDSTP